MKFKKILLVVVAIVALLVIVLVGVVAMQPAEFRITRTAVMNAPPSAVFAQVNDFHNWKAWSPWEGIDPNLKRTYEGPSSGTGAIYRWVGNSDVGEGSMTITESQPNELIRVNLVFVKPFAASSISEFTFKPQGEQTEVAWNMAGENGFMGKAFGLAMDMDQMVGGQFEQGLAQLKAVVERAP